MSDNKLVPFGDDMFRNMVSRFFEDRWSPFESSGVSLSVPKVNISEIDKEIHITADLPGLTEEEVNVEIQDGVLTLSGEHKQEKEEKDKKFYRVERSYGSFSRSFVLPAPVDENAVEAHMKDGVLHVVLPKVEQTKKKIEIKKKD